MKKFLCLLLVMIAASPAFPADDDSTPYMPYSEPSTTQRATTTTKKKTTTTKKTATKKTTTRKTTAKAASPARVTPSSLEQGIALMKQARYEAARPYLLKAIQENRNDPNAWYWYGVYHEKTGGYHQAQYFYSKAVTIDPAFEPLSRVVFQPNDSEKTPLWDPKRPARVYEIQTASTGGVRSVSPNSLGLSSFPTATGDPDSTTYSQVSEAAIYTGTETGTVRTSSQPDSIIRADLPLYTPPNPGEQTRQTPQVQTPASSTQTTTRRASVPASRVVRQNTTTKKKTTTTTARPATTTPATQRVVRQNTTPATTTRRTTSPDVRPSTPSRMQTPTRTQPTTPARQETPEPPASTQASRQSEYMPPVGQYAPDPGTVTENPIPPVGQGGQD